MWSRSFDGIVREELYDVILEIAAYAKKHLEVGRSYQEKGLPEHCHRAFLLTVEADHFLKQLEKLNFDIFDPAIRKKSQIKIPYAIYR
jgi:NADH dehydrogenase [ubiquinone] 1 alpha subcomplex assembly factor 6